MQAAKAEFDGIIVEGPSRPPKHVLKHGSCFVAEVIDDEFGQNQAPRSVVSNGEGQLYEVGVKVATAMYGGVYEAFEILNSNSPHKIRGEKRILKIISKKMMLQNKFAASEENPYHEISIMQMIGQKKNISYIIDAIEDDSFVYCVMPYFGVEIFQLSGKISEEAIRSIFRQIVFGLKSLHDRGICHRDLSLENILISESGQCTIIDFGMALILPHVRTRSENSRESPSPCCGNDEVYGNEDIAARSDGLTKADSINDECKVVVMRPRGVVGKKSYIAPEINNGADLVNWMNVDIWALGIILFMLFTGRAPFVTASETDKWFQYFMRHSLSTILTHWGFIKIPSLAVDLLERLLQSPSPNDRPSCKDILMHPWMVQ